MLLASAPRTWRPYDVQVTYGSNTVDGRGLRIGVLALQGDVREHMRILESMGADATGVRRPPELAEVDGLILPGGESTTIDRLSRIFGLAEPLKRRIDEGMPVYGSCAGMIMLADEIAEPACNAAGEPQQTFGGLDITVRRNAFGRQRESFETDLEFAQLSTDEGQPAAPVHAVFIRAPWVERAGDSVQVLARVETADAPSAQTLVQEARIVAVRSSNKLATSFHPEVTGERRIHELFIRMIRGEA